jgi:cell fate regulator YaaT (PSP1 superfamily)
VSTAAVKHLVEIAFKGNRREFFVWEGEEPPRQRVAVIVEADRGEDLGRVHSVGELAGIRCRGCSHGLGAEEPAKRMLRTASADEERRAAELRALDEEARRRAMEKVKAHALVMKVTDAEWQFDRKKLTLYFTAERRVDFRALVRDLAATFRTRIELKQIGVRDEAKRLDGIGRCGRQYCSAGWLPELRPVNLQVAKDQRLSLNPSQISGACGRLMCCLRYEHDFYVQSRKRFPKEGRMLVASRGEEKVMANDIFNDRVTLRGLDGETRVVPLAELKREIEAAGARDSVALAEEPEETDAAALDVTEGPGAFTLEHMAVTDLASLRAGPAVPPAPMATRRVEAVPPEGASGERRPHRRRGRRGGRRNRQGGQGGGQNGSQNGSHGGSQNDSNGDDDPRGN